MKGELFTLSFFFLHHLISNLQDCSYEFKKQRNSGVFQLVKITFTETPYIIDLHYFIFSSLRFFVILVAIFPL